MDLRLTLQLVAVVILLVMSGYFSASETALLSLSKVRIKHMLRNNMQTARLLESMQEEAGNTLSAILISNNTVNVTLASVSTLIAIEYFGDKGVGIATAVVTLLILVFSEITPKTLATAYAEQFSLRVARPIYTLTKVLAPLILLLTALANILLRFSGTKATNKKPFITEDELKTMVHVGHEEGVIEGKEKQMLYRVFQFGGTEAKDIMVPRADIKAISGDASYQEVIDTLKQTRYSRLPVFSGTIDQITGVLHLKDLFLMDGVQDFDLERLKREPHFTSEFKRIDRLLDEMRSNRVHLAVVVDEYGGTAGMVTIEDLLEEIVGGIFDEHDAEVDDEITQVDNDTFVVSGLLNLDAVERLLETDLPVKEYGTLSGFLTALLGRILEGEERPIVRYGDLTFDVEEIDEKMRISRVRVHKLKPHNETPS